MAWLTSPEIWISLLTLTILEIVLGIDNIVFISMHEKFDQTVEEFLNEAFHLNPDQLTVQMKAEALGLL